MRTLHTSSYPQIAVDLKLPMKAEFISHMIVMRAKILENFRPSLQVRATCSRFSLGAPPTF
jgi:hypothetical protein